MNAFLNYFYFAVSVMLSSQSQLNQYKPDSDDTLYHSLLCDARLEIVGRTVMHFTFREIQHNDHQVLLCTVMCTHILLLLHVYICTEKLHFCKLGWTGPS